MENAQQKGNTEMKIGILCTMINGFGRKGYYNSQEIGLGRALVKRGCTVCIYKSVKKEKQAQKECLEIEKGLSIRYLPVARFGAHGYLSASVLDSDLDAVLCFADNQIFLPHLYRWCRKRGICFVPYIGTVRSSNGGLHGKLLNWMFASGTLKIYQKNPVIAKVGKVKSQLEELGVPEVMVAPVGLDFAVLKQDYQAYDRNALRAEFGYRPEEMVICTVGRLGPEKRPLDLLDIFVKVRKKRDCRLLIVGEGIQSEEVAQKIRELKMEEEIQVFDRVPYEEIWKVYAISDYFVNLCATEIFGMAILEAMYYEVSVAASVAPGPSVTLQGMRGHRLCQNDKEVEKWLTDSAPTKEELEESARNVQEKYSWNSCADAVLSIVSREK